MTEVNAVDQQALKQGYARSSSQQAHNVQGSSVSIQRAKNLSKQGVGPAAILELSPEAKELIKKNR